MGCRARVLDCWSRWGLPFYSSGAKRHARPLASTTSTQNRHRRDVAKKTLRKAVILFCSFAFRRTPSSGARIDRRRPSRERSRAEFCFVAPDRSVAKKDLDEAVSLSLAFSLTRALNFVFYKLIFAPPLLCFALSWLALALTFALSLCRCPVPHFLKISDFLTF